MYINITYSWDDDEIGRFLRIFIPSETVELKKLFFSSRRCGNSRLDFGEASKILGRLLNWSLSPSYTINNEL